jgi:hypothetical protein
MDGQPDDSGSPNPYSQFALKLIPKVGEEIAQLRVDLYQRRVSRAKEAIDISLDATQLEPEEFLRRIREDEALLALFNLSIDAAMRSRVANKRKAIGEALGSALNDTAILDESELIIKALDDLDVPHIRLLFQIGSFAGENAENSEEVPAVGLLSMELFRRNTVVDTVVAALMRHGLIEQIPPHRGQEPHQKKYRLTGFGGAVLMDLGLAQCGVPIAGALSALKVDGTATAPFALDDVRTEGLGRRTWFVSDRQEK